MVDHKTRDHAILSASSSARWLACPPSAVASLAYASQDTAFTREGTLAHEVAESIARYGLAPEKEGVTQEMIDCAYEYRDYIQEHIKAPTDLVLYEQRVDFSPWVVDGFGTADCIIIHEDSMTVIDYKYGQGVKVDAEDNSQMRLYALGALNDYGFAYDVEQVDMCIFQPRMQNVSQAVMTTSNLLDWAEYVKAMAELAAKGEGRYVPGNHCTFCPHAGRCKALDSECRTFVNAHGMRVEVPVLAPWQIAEVLQMESLVTLWLKRVKEQALTSMLNGDAVPGYKVVEGKPGNRKWVSETDAYLRLLEYGLEHNDITETKLLSPAGMEKAFGKKRAAELFTFCQTVRSPGSPTVVPETDKRQPYNPADDFKNLN